MKTKTRISKTRTVTREARGTRMVRALGREEFRTPAFWKLVGESPSLVPFNPASSLAKNGADLVFFSKDKSHAVLFACGVKASGLSEAQSLLYVQQIARFLKEGEFPLKSVSVVFLVPGDQPMHQKLLASFTETFRFHTASLRNTTLRDATIKSAGSRLARNAYRYSVEFTYKEEKFEIPLTVRVVDSAGLGPLPAVPPPLPSGLPNQVAKPVPQPLPAAPAPVITPANPEMLRKLKDLLDEIVSARSREAWKNIGESCSMQRLSGITKQAPGADLVYVSKERHHCLLIDCHVGAEGLGQGQAASYLRQLSQVAAAKGFTFETASVVLLLPPKAKQKPALQELFANACVLPLRAEARGVFEASGLKIPAEALGENAFSFSADRPGGGELKVTVKIVEGPAQVY